MITEMHESFALFQESGGLKIHRIFFRRDTMRRRSKIKNGCAFALNSLLFYVYILTVAVTQERPTIIFTRNYHKHYLLALNFLKVVRKRATLVNDIRTGFPKKTLNKDLSFFDISISNSQVVENQLDNFKNLCGKRRVFLPNIVKLPRIGDIGQAFPGVEKYGFSLFCGVLDSRKSIDLVVPVMRRLYEEQGLVPVLIGREGDHRLDWVTHRFGSIPYKHRNALDQQTVFWLERFASIVLLPSRLEGLPRVAIEVLSFHGRIVLPPCCPEFEEALSLSDLDVGSVFDLAIQRRFHEYSRYNVEKHSPSIGLEKYRKTLGVK